MSPTTPNYRCVFVFVQGWCWNETQEGETRNREDASVLLKASCVLPRIMVRQLSLDTRPRGCVCASDARGAVGGEPSFPDYGLRVAIYPSHPYPTAVGDLLFFYSPKRPLSPLDAVWSIQRTKHTYVRIFLSWFAIHKILLRDPLSPRPKVPFQDLGLLFFCFLNGTAPLSSCLSNITRLTCFVLWLFTLLLRATPGRTRAAEPANSPEPQQLPSYR